MIDKTEAQRWTDAAPEATPRCMHFGACGGCQWQHLKCTTQIEAKREGLMALLERAGVRDVPSIETHSGEPWQYRNRIRLRIERAEGELRLGYSRRGSHAFLPIQECPIAAGPLWSIAEGMLQRATTDAAMQSLLENSGEVELFVSDDLSRAQVTFLARSRSSRAPARFSETIDALQGEASTRIAGAAMVYADPQSGRIVRTLAEQGAAGLAYRVGEETYWVSRGGFFQVNRFLLETMVKLVTEDAAGPRRGALAWDLFAGVGLFARVLSRGFERVTAVEANPVAIADLRAALGKRSPGSEAVEATTLEFLRRASVERDRPALVVLDPPRAGAGVEACGLLERLAPEGMVYVSCDPATLARDLAVLQPAYRLAALHLLDLFPQTVHVETVAILVRRG